VNDERKFYARIFTKEPRRMFRGAEPMLEGDVLQFMGQINEKLAYVNLNTKDGRVVIIPGPNFAYAEFVPASGGSDEVPSSDS